MSRMMKILIAYDGETGAEALLTDLKSAGLPSQVMALVLSVTEPWPTLQPRFGMVKPEYAAMHHNVEINKYVMSMRAAGKVMTTFDDWEVRAETAVGSAAGLIVSKSDEFPADLIVVGSHGLSTLGRFFLGSVSLSVLHAARCSVRIARGRPTEPGTPLRLIIGVDGSTYAESAVEVVAERNWPAGTAVRLVNGLSVEMSERGEVDYLREHGDDGLRVQASIEAATAKLQGKGLKVSNIVKKADPAQLILGEAEEWDAHCIFVGARGRGAFARLLLGSVSSAVAERAHCSVEVVRARR